MNWQPLFAERTAHMRRSTVRELLKALNQPGMISFAGGIPAPELFPVREVAEAVTTVLQRCGAAALQYGETEGVRELRDWIAARASRPQFQVRRENVLIVAGSQQALDLLGKVFLNAGDRVLVENPTYLAMLSAWRPLSPAFVPVPSDGQGMCVDGLPGLLEQGGKPRTPEAPTGSKTSRGIEVRPLTPSLSPSDGERVPFRAGEGKSANSAHFLGSGGVKLIYLVPNFQNPQGTTLSLARRRQLAEYVRASVARRGRSGGASEVREVRPALVEDDPYGELRYSGEALPSLLELDARADAAGALDTCVIHLGTFSKTLAPGLRVGWVIAPAEVIDKLVQAKQAADLHTSTLCQHVILQLLRDGVLEQQLPKLCVAYRQRRDTMLAALAKNFPHGTTWTRPEGGMFLLVTLPPRCQAKALLERALEQKVAFVPGDDFHLDGTGANTMRLNFSNATPERIEEGVRRLALLLAEAGGED
jgi:2-aminoadipate transaminase